MRKKGFTLIELIIVIAIMGVLAGVLIPSWAHYIQRSRTRSQNLKAKTVLNAAQTVVTDMKFAERRDMNDYNNASVSEKALTAKRYIYGDIIEVGDGAEKHTTTEWYYYWDGSTGTMTKADGTPIAPDGYWNSKKKAWNDKIADSINQIINEDELIYKIYVRDYKVMSVVTARFASDRYLGTYPTTLDELENKNPSADIEKIRADGVKKADMSQFLLP